MSLPACPECNQPAPYHTHRCPRRRRAGGSVSSVGALAIAGFAATREGEGALAIVSFSRKWEESE